MLNKILDAIYQAYLDEVFNEQIGISSAFELERSSAAYLDDLCDSDMKVTVKIQKENSVSEEEYSMANIISKALGHGEEVGFKNGFLVGMLFGDQINGKHIHFDCRN